MSQSEPDPLSGSFEASNQTTSQPSDVKSAQEFRLDEGLIQELKDEANFLAVKYNQINNPDFKEQVVQFTEEGDLVVPQIVPSIKSVINMQPINKIAANRQETMLKNQLANRTGGVYVPPHKLREMQQQMLKEANNDPKILQRFKWDLLKKSINSIVNKVNVENMQNVIIELLNENILRGKGLVARAIIKSQMSAVTFTPIYAAMIAVINTKLPEIANLVIRRVVMQFRMSYQRNDKMVCRATIKFLAHLINQKVLTDFFGLEILAFLLEDPTEDSVDLACDFMKESGQVLTDLCPSGVNAIFERFKGILHEGNSERRVQYAIENLFAVRKNKFESHPGVIPELDLVEEEDQITHNISLDDDLNGEPSLNIFKFDPDFEQNEQEWIEIKTEILGEENILKLKTSAFGKVDSDEEEEQKEVIKDFTEEDVMKLRQNIYLIIMNSVDYEACAHKLMKLGIGTGHEDEFCEMIVDCCMKERTYLRFFGLLAERFCNIDDAYRQQFFKLFIEKYTVVHRFKTNKVRNLAKMFAHLLLTDALDWHVLKCVTLTENATTSSSRIFLKLLFQELAENMGLKSFCEKIQDPEMQEYFVGLFPKDNPKNTRFAINFFALIGLDAATSDLKKYLESEAQLNEEELALLADSSSSSSSSDSDSSSSGSSSSKKKSTSTEKNSKVSHAKVRPKLLRESSSESRQKRDHNKTATRNRSEERKQPNQKQGRSRSRSRDKRQQSQKRFQRRSKSDSRDRKRRRNSREIRKKDNSREKKYVDTRRQTKGFERRHKPSLEQKKQRSSPSQSSSSSSSSSSKIGSRSRDVAKLQVAKTKELQKKDSNPSPQNDTAASGAFMQRARKISKSLDSDDLLSNSVERRKRIAEKRRQKKREQVPATQDQKIQPSQKKSEIDQKRVRSRSQDKRKDNSSLKELKIDKTSSRHREEKVNNHKKISPNNRRDKNRKSQNNKRGRKARSSSSSSSQTSHSSSSSRSSSSSFKKQKSSNKKNQNSRKVDPKKPSSRSESTVSLKIKKSVSGVTKQVEQEDKANRKAHDNSNQGLVNSGDKTKSNPAPKQIDEKVKIAVKRDTRRRQSSSRSSLSSSLSSSSSLDTRK